MRHTIRRRSLIGAAGLSVAALVLAGCAGAEEPAADETATDAGGTEETAELAAGCEAYADYAGNEGTEVEIYTTIIDPEAALFIESFVEFEECTGIDIVWNGDQAFEEQIAVRVEGGTAPDLAVFPSRVCSHSSRLTLSPPKQTLPRLWTRTTPLTGRATEPLTEPSTARRLAPT